MAKPFLMPFLISSARLYERSIPADAQTLHTISYQQMEFSISVQTVFPLSLPRAMVSIQPPHLLPFSSLSQSRFPNHSLHRRQTAIGSGALCTGVSAVTDVGTTGSSTTRAGELSASTGAGVSST